MKEIIGCLEIRRRLIREQKGRRERYQDDFFLLAARFAHMALAALRASAERCSAVWARVRALPPLLPRATAAGFFRFFIGSFYHEDSSTDAKRLVTSTNEVDYRA
jgi:hypothetical protein